MEKSECLLNVAKDKECLLNDENETLMQQNRKYRAEYIYVAAQQDIFWKFRRESFAACGVVKESPRSDNLVADKLLEGDNGDKKEAAYHTAMCLATTFQNTDNVTSPPDS